VTYTPHTPADIRAMLEAVGANELTDLVKVPDAVSLRKPLTDIPGPMPEREIASKFGALAARNTAVEHASFLGAGVYRHYVPPVIAALAMRGEFLTSYTPYQAEVSQGYLQAIYEWQTYICLLTGMDLANASVYDGATALAEGAIMAVNETGRRRLLVSKAVHPNYRAVLRTYAEGLDVAVDELDVLPTGATGFGDLSGKLAGTAYAAVILQSPNFFGIVDTPSAEESRAIATAGSVQIGVVAEALSLAVLSAPRAWGCEICVGEAQSFGVAQAFGGPHVGFIACTKDHMRRIPGRLVGRTVDADGRTAYVLTLQAREQHIRREKATSNICTNQAHCALIATIYLASMGATGLRDCALENLAQTKKTRDAVCSVPGIGLAFGGATFNEFVVRVPAKAGDVLAALRKRRVLGGLDMARFYPELDDAILITATELTTQSDIDALADGLRAVLPSLRSKKFAAAG
jgi:glycine dehydrogenase subunit 1